MPWPLSQDYNEAIQSPASNFADADLRRGEPACNALGLPMPYSGNFADVYQMRCHDGSRWAVKCFTREAAGLRERYQEISGHLKQAKLPFTVDFNYLENGIRVAGRWYPVLKMQWVEGLTLNQFVKQHLDRPATLEALLQLWGKMATYLRAAQVGHCDLQHGNVLLVPGADAHSLKLKLIDYDGMWVPALAGKKSGEVGHPNYQHPQRMVEGTYSLEVDRFPVLLVAAALRALKAKGQELWAKYDNGDNLLFKETDLREPARSALVRELSQMGDPATAGVTAPLVKSLWARLEMAPLLEEVMPEAKASMASAPGKVTHMAPVTAPNRPSRLGPTAAPAVAAVIPVAAVAVVPVAAVAVVPVAAVVTAGLEFDASAPNVERPRRRRGGTAADGATRGKQVAAVLIAVVVVLGSLGGFAYWAVNGAPNVPETAPPEPIDKAAPPKAATEAFVVLQIEQAGAVVSVDGIEAPTRAWGDYEPLRIKVKPGKHKLIVSRDGFADKAGEVFLLSGQTETLRVQLRPIYK